MMGADRKRSKTEDHPATSKQRLARLGRELRLARSMIEKLEAKNERLVKELEELRRSQSALGFLRRKMDGIRARVLVSSAERCTSVGRLHSTLTEAESAASGGEVVVRSRRRVGRVHFVRGEVVWVHVQDSPAGLVQRFVANCDISPDDLRAAHDQSRTTGANFLETLLAWNLVDDQELREVLRGLFTERLAEMAAWPFLQALFVPQEPSCYGSSIRFALGELTGDWGRDAACDWPP